MLRCRTEFNETLVCRRLQILINGQFMMNGSNPGTQDLISTTGLLTTLFVYIFSRLAQASVQALNNVFLSPVVLGPGIYPKTLRGFTDI